MNSIDRFRGVALVSDTWKRDSLDPLSVWRYSIYTQGSRVRFAGRLIQKNILSKLARVGVLIDAPGKKNTLSDIPRNTKKSMVKKCEGKI